MLVRLLHSERDARVPVATDCAPFYHWRDLRKFLRERIDCARENDAWE